MSLAFCVSLFCIELLDSKIWRIVQPLEFRRYRKAFINTSWVSKIGADTAEKNKQVIQSRGSPYDLAATTQHSFGGSFSAVSNTDFHNQILILQHFSRSTKWSSSIWQNFAKFRKIWLKFRKFLQNLGEISGFWKILQKFCRILQNFCKIAKKIEN